MAGRHQESNVKLVPGNEVNIELDVIAVEEADLDSNSSQDGAASFNVGDAVSNSESSSDLIQIDDNLAGAIEKGDPEGAFASWLESLPASSDEKKTILNTIRYNNSSTALHLAAEYNCPKIARLLLDEGADPNIKRTDVSEDADDEEESKENDSSALHIACSNSAEADISDLVQLLVENRNCNIDAADSLHHTPLHIAAKRNHISAVKILLAKGADMQLKDDNGDQPIHIAAEAGNYDIVELLIEKNAECVHWLSDNYETPLHRVCAHSHNIRITKLLIDKGANVNAVDDGGDTPLVCASEDQNNTELVELLLNNGADVNPPPGEESDTPLQTACFFGCSDIVSLLLKHGAKVDSKALEKAVSEGYEGIVKELIQKPEWPQLMRHIIEDDSEEGTTPFREMIKKMPDVAEEILNKCTVNDPEYTNPDDPDYCVAFNYEFIEDTRDDKKRTDDRRRKPRLNLKDEEDRYGCGYRTIEQRKKESYTSSWGPVGFKKATHPLAIMVESKRLNLLTHPLVGSLLHHKWRKFGQYGYFANLLIYCVFVIFLTTFALIVQNPRSEACLKINETRIDCVSFPDPKLQGLGSGNGAYNCSIRGISGISTHRLVAIYFSAIVVIILSLFRLVILEGIQFITQRSRYLLDWVNWIEITLFICSIIYVWVFHTDCLCPLTWQWQIGVVAVFLSWFDLIIFISKFPLTGIYVLMFVKILYTFLKMLILSVLLVFAFGLTFYLAFTQPEILRSPFSHPGRSLLKTMTMATGEFDFDPIFRQDPTGARDNDEEIPFPPVSYILWIVFIVIMPILLTNMLVGLAVDDIQTIQKEAALQKLALQVEQVLTVEELLPPKLRRRFTTGFMKVSPNKGVSWRKKFLFIVWGGERYNTRASIGKVLHPNEDETERLQRKTDKLLHEVDGMKDENEKLHGKTDKLLQEVEDMKHLIKQLITKLEENKKN